MSERAEMECKRCGDNEDRIDGFCSNECKDKYSLEAALSKMSIRIAELESAQRWRVVADGEMPELDQDVFAVVEGEIKVGHFYQELDFIEPDDDDEEGNIYFSAFDDGLLVATHWFPIPDGLEESER